MHQRLLRQVPAALHASWRRAAAAAASTEAPTRAVAAPAAAAAAPLADWRHPSSSSSSTGAVRRYHASALVAAKPSKKGKGKGKAASDDDDNDDDDSNGDGADGNDDDAGSRKGGGKRAGKAGAAAAGDASQAAMKLPDMKALEGQMDTKLQRMASEFAKLRTGQANTELFKTVTVEAHGARISVADAGQIAVKSSTKISIAVFDPALVANVANAIRDCGMSLNPTIEGNNVAVSIPKPSKETRDALVKTAGRIAEKAKQDVRQVRKDGMDHLKKLKGTVSEDDVRRLSKDIDALMEKHVEKVSKALKEKENDIMS